MFNIYDIYTDDNLSGGKEDRLDFQRLINDVKNAKFSKVISVTIARFCNNYETFIKYLYTLFLELGIKFIGITDRVDASDKNQRKKAQLMMLNHQWYIEDTSKNIKTTMNAFRRKGKYIGSFTCYGYKKNPADIHKLVIDEEAVIIVRLIFNKYFEEWGIIVFL